MIRPLLPTALVVFSIGVNPGAARAQGRSIQARDGDIVLVPTNATITVARVVPGYVKIIAHKEGRLLIVLFDEGPQPDGIVDYFYRFDLPQPYEPAHAGEGAGSFEHYDVVGDQGALRSYGIVLPHGRIFLKSGSPVRPSAAVPENIATLQFKGVVSGRIRETFADAEQRALRGTGTDSQVQFGVSAPTAAVSVAAAPTDAPVRVGGNVPQPVKTRDVAPVMPPAARQAGMMGIVIVEITIDVQGRVSNARILRSIPLLDQAALDAVRQWEFSPTYVNGQARPVIMTVTVPFMAQD